MKKKGLLADALIGLTLTGVIAGAWLVRHPLLESAEFKLYDLRSQLRQDLNPPSELILVAIDDASIDQLGRWPWPRSRMAAAIEKIRAQGPKAIGFNILLSEPEYNPGLAELKRLEEAYAALLAAKQVTQKKGVDFALEFSSSAVALDSDSKLLAAIKASPDVYLPLVFTPAPLGAKPDPAPPAVSSASIPALASLEAPEESKLLHPILPLAEAAAGMGHVSLYPEVDGVIRRESPLVKYGDRMFPSFALRLVMAYMGYGPEELRAEPGALHVGKLAIPLDAEGQMAISFAGPDDTIKQVPFVDVMNDKVSSDLFKGKIAIVGLTASGVAPRFVTPVAAGLPSMEVVANAVENILHQKFLTRPAWADNAELGLVLFIGLFIALVLPRLRALWGLVLSMILAMALFGSGTYLFVNGQWLKIGYPATLLLVGYLIIISKSFLTTEKGKELVEASQIETNKMLGLSFQGQGMLDLAFEKFRLCPLDENMKDTLYNLGLDFERKRQFSKAAAVLDHIAAKDPKYKDVVEKGKMLKAASEGAVFGGVGGGKKEGTVMIAGGATKPTLGRYEIEKELGRGAMGVVYLGRDPKINRMVAIKTMMLEEGSDGESAKQVKERFFREAESAGTLNHPNIVRIFDAGEENDVAYIAMELLDGHDFVKYTTKEGLLPLDKAVDYVATVADALDYAHAQGIVHRDIKPANFMLLKDGSVRVADFGIARITASSKTATGTVMGTPSYMSPEQVAGKKVDGRSDLFSLTVALFELVTGEKPFKGGEGIGTLLFQIANDPHPDALALRPDLPPALKAVIDRGLAKNPDQRFQRGSELAAALRAALKGIAPAAAPAAAAPAPAPAASPPTATAPSFPTAPVPAAEPSPAAPPLEKKPFVPPASDKTVRIGPEITIPGLNDRPRPKTIPPTPVEQLRPTPPAPIESSLGDTAQLQIEQPQRGGAGPKIDVPPPPASPASGLKTDVPPPPPSPAQALDIDVPPPSSPGGLGIEPTQDPNATIKLKPNSQEPV